MLKSLMLVSASAFALMLIAPVGSHIGPDPAFGIGAGAGGAAGGVGGAAGGAAGAAKGGPSAAAGGGSDAKDNSSLAAFMASPVFAHVGPAVPSTVTAGTVYIAHTGLPCQAMTQIID